MGVVPVSRPQTALLHSRNVLRFARCAGSVEEERGGEESGGGEEERGEGGGNAEGGDSRLLLSPVHDQESR